MLSGLRSRLADPVWLIAAASLALHLYTSSGYGYFRDELYFIACGRHPAWGYVDQPPLVPLLAAGMQALFPFSLVALRLPPALAHGATILLTGEAARALGGSRFAQGLAALCVLVGGVYLATGTILITDLVQPLTWLFCAYGLIRLLRGGDRRWFLAVGAASGAGLLTKYMLTFWLIALLLGLLATPQRRLLAQPWCWLGIVLAVAMVLPNIIWQASHGFPFLAVGSDAAHRKNIVLSPLAFMLAEADELNAVTAPVWIAGLAAFAFWRRFSDLRGFAIAFVVLIAVMLAVHAKPYYPAGTYPLLFAAGAVAIEAWIRSVIVRGVLTGAILAGGIIAAPFATPILPIRLFAAYQERLHVAPHSLENAPIGRLPQLYADMFGWPEMAALVGRAYAALPPADQARAVFLGTNYGEAAAIDMFGPAWHLPPAISGHNTYDLWGPRGHDGSVVLRLGGSRKALLKVYASVEPAGVFEHPWAMPTETGRTLWICRGRTPHLDADWSSFRHYD